MGILADRLDGLMFTVHSPDGQLLATVSGRDHVAVRFRPGAYRRYDESTLAQQLTRLAAAVWVDSQRHYREAFSEATGRRFDPPTVVQGSMTHRYHRDLAGIEAEGWSAAGWVGIWTQGMRHWNVVIPPGAVAALTEQELTTELVEAVQSLLTSYRLEVHRLRDEHFGLQLPGAGP